MEKGDGMCETEDWNESRCGKRSKGANKDFFSRGLGGGVMRGDWQR